MKNTRRHKLAYKRNAGTCASVEHTSRAARVVHRRSATVLLGNSRHLGARQPARWGKRILYSSLAFGGALCAIPFRQASAPGPTLNPEATFARGACESLTVAPVLFPCGRQKTCPTIPSSNEPRPWRRTARALSCRRPPWLLWTPSPSTPK